MTADVEPVLRLLIDEGALAAGRVEEARGAAAREAVPLGRWILGAGWISRDRWAETAARALAIAFEREPRADADVAMKWPAEFFARHRALPLRIDGGRTLVVAVSDPTDVENLEAIESFVRMPVRATAAPESFLSTARPRPRSESEDVESSRVLSLEETQGEAHLRSLHELLQLAVERNATDVHLEWDGATLAARLRVDGLLVAVPWRAVAAAGNPLVNRLKVLAGVDVTEARTPQDGSFVLRSPASIDVRASFLPVRNGTAVVLRLLDPARLARAGTRMTLEELGFAAVERDALLAAARRPHGFVLVTGPTGAGKSTTLYGLLAEVDDPSRKIVTIEDPVEYRLASATQVEVNEAAGLTFAAGLRSILRHDPDRILVGEIRDEETAKIALQAAVTGHLVFATLHAATASGVEARLRSLGVAPDDFDASMMTVVAQRLVRRMCPTCAGKGCPACGGSGLRGRFVLAEVSVGATGARSPAPLRTIRDVAAEALARGLTTKPEIERVWPEALG